MKRLVIILSLVCGSLWGQSGSAGTSVYSAQLYTNSNATGVSITVPNIGQIGHQVFIVLSNAPAKTCLASTAALGGQLEFSYNTSNWFAFGSPTNNPAEPNLFQTYFGNGVYPFVRFNLTSFDTTNCIANGYYTGTSNSAALGSSTITTGTSIPSNVYVTVAGGIGNERVQPSYICTQHFANLGGAIPAGTYSFATLNASGFGSTYGFCNLYATSIGVATVQIVAGVGASCTGPVAVTPAFNLVAGVPIAFGSSTGLMVNPISYSVGVANTLCVATTGANTNIVFGFTVI